MSKNTGCPACLAYEKGIRSRIPFKHTCGLEPKALKANGKEILTFDEIKESVLNDPRINVKQKLELLPITDMKTLSAKLVEMLKVNEDEIQIKLL